MYLLEISAFSLNNVIFSLTKIMNRADKNWTLFYDIKYFINQSFQIISIINIGFLIKYASPKNDFETQNVEIFDKVVHNFGKPDEVII